MCQILLHQCITYDAGRSRLQRAIRVVLISKHGFLQTNNNQIIERQVRPPLHATRTRQTRRSLRSHNLWIKETCYFYLVIQTELYILLYILPALYTFPELCLAMHKQLITIQTTTIPIFIMLIVLLSICSLFTLSLTILCNIYKQQYRRTQNNSLSFIVK